MAKCIKITQSENRKGFFTLYFEKSSKDVEKVLNTTNTISSKYSYTIKNDSFCLEDLINKFLNKDININCYDFTVKEMMGTTAIQIDGKDITINEFHKASFKTREEEKSELIKWIKRCIKSKYFTLINGFAFQFSSSATMQTDILARHMESNIFSEAFCLGVADALYKYDHNPKPNILDNIGIATNNDTYSEYIENNYSEYSKGKDIGLYYRENYSHHNSIPVIWCKGYAKAYLYAYSVAKPSFIKQLLAHKRYIVTDEGAFVGWSYCFYLDGIARGLIKKAQVEGLLGLIDKCDEMAFEMASQDERWLMGFLYGITRKKNIHLFNCLINNDCSLDNYIKYHEDFLDMWDYDQYKNDYWDGVKCGLLMQPMFFRKTKDGAIVGNPYYFNTDYYYLHDINTNIAIKNNSLWLQRGYLVGYKIWDSPQTIPEEYKDNYDKGLYLGEKDRMNPIHRKLDKSILCFISGLTTIGYSEFYGEEREPDVTGEHIDLSTKYFEQFLLGVHCTTHYATYIGEEEGRIKAETCKENNEDTENITPPTLFVRPQQQIAFEEAFNREFYGHLEELTPSYGYTWTEEDSWDAMTDGMYGKIPKGWDGDFEFLGY